jgi:ketosteroid isomerase-like protein
MKIRLLTAVAGFALSLASPISAQEKETQLSEQDREQIISIGRKNDEAWSKSDAAALGALFTEDAVFVTPAGVISGRAAIEKRDQEVFTKLQKRFEGNPSSESKHITNVTKAPEMHAIDENTAWGVGEWTQTIPGPDNTVKEVHGHFGSVTVRDGDFWKTRMLTVNVAPTPTATASLGNQSNTPDPQLRAELLALAKNFEDAWNNNDADALAALYTKDGVVIENSGPVYGRDAIKKHFEDLFQNVHFSNNHTTYNDPISDSPHAIGTDGNMMWENGEWSITWQVKGCDPVQAKGYHASIAVREDGVWKKRMTITNETPPAAK